MLIFKTFRLLLKPSSVKESKLLSPDQTVMIFDDSFADPSYHTLSLTIMFVIKRSMIVDDSLSK